MSRLHLAMNKTMHFVLVDAVSWDRDGKKTSHEMNDEPKFSIGERLTNETI